MNILLWIAGGLSFLYGAVTALAGLAQLRTKAIQSWAALGMGFFGVVVIAAGIMIFQGAPGALWALLLGLLGIHALAVNNGLKMHGRITPSHHIARAALSLVLLVLTYLALR